MWLVAHVWLWIFSSSVFMKVKVNAPIHAATAMLTATVTAIKIMAATTGLNAFLLLNSFLIFYMFPPLGVHVEHTVAKDLNLTS
jgi:hypothetical protein